MERMRLGIAGVGIAALQVMANLNDLVQEIELTALADIRRDNMEYFATAFGRPLTMFDTVEAMCASPLVDAVWVASPNVFHAEHTIAAAEHGKHVICEKPMAVTLDQCLRMVEAVQRNGVKYVQGHSKAYDQPVRKMGEIVRSGELGRVVHIETSNFNDWLIRALTPDEVDTDLGTGVVFRQGPHQIDTVRYIAGSKVRSVRAVTGRWSPSFPKCEGNYTALLDFEDGAVATLVFDGYGYYDVTELTWGMGEAGLRSKNPESIGPRYRPPGPVTPDEKYAQVRGGNPYGYGAGSGYEPAPTPGQPFFGLTIVSCERGVIRQSRDGIYVYGVDGRREVALPPNRGRAAELFELYESVVHNRPTTLDARWGLATAEVCLAILESSRERRDVILSHQSAAPVLLAG
jgi:phthalate 4,5-cis-dihydrodiol dehydrogenase